MKPILATIALLLVSGCASKPKPILEYGVNSCGQKWIAANCRHGWFVDFNHPAWMKIVGKDDASENDLRRGISSLTCHRETAEEIRSTAETLAKCPSHFVVQALAWLPPTEGSISHVTREQWEAAQGLYNNAGATHLVFNREHTVAMISCDGGYHFIDLGVKDGNTEWECVKDGQEQIIGDTFPPSGDAK